MEEETTEQSNSRPWLYKKGQSGNPSGRPKGVKTLKTYIKEKFEKMLPEEREEFLQGMDKKTIWEMGEGKAVSNTDITSGGEKLPVLVKFITEKDDREIEDNRNPTGV